MANGVRSYFDLGRSARAGVAPAPAPAQPELAKWLPQYLALVAGVIAEPFFHAYQQSKAAPIGDWKLVLFAAVVGVLILPATYRNAWDPTKPVFVQVCTLIAAGMGWQSLIQTGAKAIGGGT